MAGGGKGDKQESQIKLPPEVQALATRNLQAAEKAGKIGYVPYQGPTVAALNPMQVNSMQQNANAMSAFGMAPANVAAAIPKAKTYAGGVQGYDPLALYTQAVKKIAPTQAAQIMSPTFVKDGGSLGVGGVTKLTSPSGKVTTIKPPKAVQQAVKAQAQAVKNVAKKAKQLTWVPGAPRGAPQKAKYYREGASYRFGGQQYFFKNGALHRVTGAHY